MREQYQLVQDDVTYLRKHGVRIPKKPNGRFYPRRWKTWTQKITRLADDLTERLIAEEERAEEAWVQFIMKSPCTPRPLIRY